MSWLALGVFLLAIGLLSWILRARKSSIKGEESRNQYFQQLAKELDFQFVTDGYFIQLQRACDGMHVIVYPHNFEGPGLVTLLYLETTMPATDRNWIEPNLSLGRALVEWKKNAQYGYEVSGRDFDKKNVIEALDAIKIRYPYVAITVPWRFSYSPLLQKALRSWKNYAVFLAIDVGRQPAAGQLRQALRDAEGLALAIAQRETFSDTTG